MVCVGNQLKKEETIEEEVKQIYKIQMENMPPQIDSEALMRELQMWIKDLE
jgi:hypothetical protein